MRNGAARKWPVVALGLADLTSLLDGVTKMRVRQAAPDRICYPGTLYGGIPGAAG